LTFNSSSVDLQLSRTPTLRAGPRQVSTLALVASEAAAGRGDDNGDDPEAGPRPKVVSHG